MVCMQGPSPFSGLWTIPTGRTFGGAFHTPARVQEGGIRASSFIKILILAEKSPREHLFTVSSVAVLRFPSCQSINLLTLTESRPHVYTRDAFPAAATTFQPPFGSNSPACVHTRRACCHRRVLRCFGTSCTCDDSKRCSPLGRKSLM